MSYNIILNTVKYVLKIGNKNNNKYAKIRILKLS